jgi:hypothetical protein
MQQVLLPQMHGLKSKVWPPVLLLPPKVKRMKMRRNQIRKKNVRQKGTSEVGEATQGLRRVHLLRRK